MEQAALFFGFNDWLKGFLVEFHIICCMFLFGRKVSQLMMLSRFFTSMLNIAYGFNADCFENLVGFFVVNTLVPLFRKNLVLCNIILILISTCWKFCSELEIDNKISPFHCKALCNLLKVTVFSLFCYREVQTTLQISSNCGDLSLVSTSHLTNKHENRAIRIEPWLIEISSGFSASFVFNLLAFSLSWWNAFALSLTMFIFI